MYWGTFLAGLATVATALPVQRKDGLQVQLSVNDGLLNGTSVDGRIVLMFAPAGQAPLDDYDVTSSPNQIYGQNALRFVSSDVVTLWGGNNYTTDYGVYGWPNVSMTDLPAGSYAAQAFLTVYETQTRSDGSTVQLRFPCGDGAVSVDGPGSLETAITNVTVKAGAQTLRLNFSSVAPPEDFSGHEIGGCHQGNYEDTKFLKHVKIRSDKLSAFWNRHMYVGANVLLPHGYNANDTSKRYPVIYSQGHWPGGGGAFRYSSSESFAAAWDAGVIPNTSVHAGQPAPQMILVTFRHETPFYDDSYAVNNANMGPWGDAINEELIPHIDATFNTIAAPYARIQEGGSTGGWESAANLIFRPDLFGACFSSYPDSLDFHRHQDIPLYTAENAYTRPNGSFINSIRTYENDTEVILATTAQENHWELTFGTSSRSFLQWDVWQTVFGVQGYNNYPLEAWDKVTGEIYPGAVEYWKHMDLAYYVTHHWDSERNLGEVLRHRIFVYVGERDNYYLNGGVHQFDSRVTAMGGEGWANFTYIAENEHGGNYQDREIWDYLLLLDSWIRDHAPNGTTPLSGDVTMSIARGNYWEEVLDYGGRAAAVARQTPPAILHDGDRSWKHRNEVRATVGRWDPGVELEAVWLVNGRPRGRGFGVVQGQIVAYQGRKLPWARDTLQLAVTGRKRGYTTETRESEAMYL